MLTLDDLSLIPPARDASHCTNADNGQVASTGWTNLQKIVFFLSFLFQSVTSIYRPLFRRGADADRETWETHACQTAQTTSQ